MRTSLSHKPALVHYLPQLVRWIYWAWTIYRFVDRVMVLAEVMFS